MPWPSSPIEKENSLHTTRFHWDHKLTSYRLLIVFQLLLSLFNSREFSKDFIFLANLSLSILTKVAKAVFTSHIAVENEDL